MLFIILLVLIHLDPHHLHHPVLFILQLDLDIYLAECCSTSRLEMPAGAELQVVGVENAAR